MSDLVGTTVDTHLDTDTPSVQIDGAGFDYASLRIGGNNGFIQFFGGTGTRAGDLARLTGLATAALNAALEAGETQT
jgi:hypothetical protein